MSVRLSAPLPWRFGDYRPPPALRELAGTPMAWTESIADRAELRVIPYLRKPRIVAMLRALVGAGVQDLHDIAYRMLVSRWIDTALGAQLDRLGWIVAMPRSGWPDETYRRILRAQILTLRSDGTTPHLLKILEALGATLSGVQFRDDGVAAGAIRTVDDFDAGPIGSRFVAMLLIRAKAAGVRLLVEHPGGELAESFTLATTSSPERDVDLGAGDTLDSAAGGVMAGVHGSTTTET